MPNSPILIYVIVVAAIMAFLFGASLFLGEGSSGGSAKRLNRRLSLIAEHGSDARIAYEKLRRHSIGEGASPRMAQLLDSKPIRALDTLVGTSGLGITTQRFMAFCAAGFVLVFLMSNAFGLAPVERALLSAVLAIGVPWWALRFMQRRRAQKIVLQLPDALEMLVRSLRAGHPVMTGMNLVAEEMPDPIGTEFGLVYDEMSYGLDIRESLEKMALRLQIIEIDYMVVAIRVQQGTGGSLAEILTSFVAVMRQRALLTAKVKAVSAEARLSAKILGGLPIVVVGAINLINPHYYDEAKTNPALAYVLGGAALLAFIGILLLRRVTDIRV